MDTIKQFSKQELEQLIEQAQSAPLCLSIYFSTHVSGSEIRQDPIRLKNLLTQAKTQLETGEWGELSASKIDNLLAPARQLVEDDSGEFWRHQGEGLALFLTEQVFSCYRLPISVEEMVFMGDRFHLKPLMRLISGDGQYYVLALSQGEIRLFYGTAFEIHKVELERVPFSIEEVLKYDDPEEQIRFHMGDTGGSPIYHGQGVGTTSDKDNLRPYVQQVDKGLSSFLQNQSIPMILAGVEYLQTIYRENSSYSHLLPEGIEGNVEHLKPEDLHLQAWQIAQPYFERSQQEAIDIYHEQLGTGQATAQIQDIVPAAYYGQVGTLLVAIGEHQWGKFDPQENRLEFHDQPQANDDDLIDRTAVYTLMNGGKVYPLKPEQMPDSEAIAAIFRYPVLSGQAPGDRQKQ